jgi:tungstate transport system permease protein
MGEALGRAIQLIFSADREVFGISATSLVLALLSTVLAGVLGILVAVLLRIRDFPGRRAILVILNAFMALPTVVIGLTIYGLLSRSGPLGPLGLLFTRRAIVIGQTVLALPIVTSLAYTALAGAGDTVQETLTSLGITGFRRWLIVIDEARSAIIIAMVTGFGRVVGEVGVSMMLGGNIRWHTRTITTAIVLETGKGEFEQALALGLILVTISLGVNAILRAGIRDER